MRKWTVAVGIAVTVLCSVALAQIQAKKSVTGPKQGSVQKTMGAEQQSLTAPRADTQTPAPLSAKKGVVQGANAEPLTQLDAPQQLTNLADGTAMTVNDVRDPNDTWPCSAAVLRSCNAHLETAITFSLPYTELSTDKPTCVPANYAVGNPKWYKFKPTAKGVRVSTCTAATDPNSRPQIPDTWIQIYKCTDPNNLCNTKTPALCDNDHCPGVLDCCLNSTDDDPNHSGLGSWAVGTVDPNSWYLIQVGVIGWHTEAGDYSAPMGGYKLFVDCNDSYAACDMICVGGDVPEREMGPADTTNRFNDGCAGDPTAPFPEFGTIRCDETVCGSSWSNGVGGLDPDWYRIVLPAPATKLDWYVKAQFTASFQIIKPGTDPNNPCDPNSRVVLAYNDPNAFVQCSPDPAAAYAHVFITPAPAGEYWLTVTPVGTAPVGRIYEAKVTETSCTVATGACCDASVDPNHPTCNVTAAASCTAAAQNYWGDGTTCPPGNGCWVCGGPNINTNYEAVCSDGFVDNYDSGCAFSETNPALPNEFVCNTTWCGTTGTFVTAGTNARDNDWYYVDLTNGVGNPVWLDPTGTSCEARKINIQAYADFDAEVLIWNFPDPQNPCVTPDVSVDVYARAGEPIEFSFCKTKVPDAMHLYHDFYVVVRPAFRGTSREFPCGGHYSIYMSCDTTCAVGACCLANSCEVVTPVKCCDDGGYFTGSGTACDDVFCACDPVLPLENETNCNNPPDTVDGGCNDTPWNFLTVSGSGSGYCGTVAVWSDAQYIHRDIDHYLYTHTGGDLAIYLGAQFTGLCWFGGPYPGGTAQMCDPNDQTMGIQLDLAPYEYTDLVYRPAAEVPAGLYQIEVTSDFRANGDFPCTDNKRYEFIMISGVQGACCYGTECAINYADFCSFSGGTWQGNNTTCTPNPCATGACCTPTGGCTQTLQSACLTPNVWNGGWTTCSPNPCPQLGACCNPTTGGCTQTLQSACTTPNIWHGNWTTCLPNPCPQPLGACCNPTTGGCTQTLQSACTYNWHGEWTTCSPNPCPQPNPTGACCSSTGCTVTLQSACTTPSVWMGAGTTCTPSPCTGACCSVTGTCSVITSAACGTTGHYYGNNTTCRPGNKCPASCRGDMNCDGQVTFADIDLFVAALAGEPAWTHWPCPWINGDCTADGNVTFADIDPFVARIGHPCP